MDDDDVMRFEVTDQDLEEEMTMGVGGGRGKKRMSKNQAIYGVFAAQSSDEEDEGQSFNAGRKKNSQRDFTNPVNFVSGGVVGAKKKEKKEEGDEEGGNSEGDMSSDEGEFSGNTGGGLGFGSRRKGAGRVEGEGQIAGMRTSGYVPQQSLGKGFGDWEKHTKGIGAKLLLQMGYQAGKGLGKNLEGRTKIVEAFVRKGKGCVGAYGSEGGGPKAQKVRGDSEDEEEKKFKDKLSQWRTGGQVAGKKKKVEYVYKSVEDVLQEGKWRKVRKDEGGKAAAVKVIDLTGKERRELSGYHAIGGQQKPDEDGESSAPIGALQEKRKANFELPELVHNLNLLVDLCEQDILSSDRKLAHHKDRVQVLQMEGEKLTELVEKEKAQIDSISQIIAVIDKLEERHDNETLDMDLALRAFKKLQQEFRVEFQMYQLGYIATTIVLPMLKKNLSSWQPLAGRQENLQCITIFTNWKEVLEDDNDGAAQPGAEQPMSPYHNLVWEAWLPQVRQAINRWSPRQPESLISFLDLWRPLLPVWILGNVLEQIVLPKLQAEVEVWNPLTDSTPIHAWLHPWLPPLGNRLEIVYPTIRNKLANALNNWHPSDRSAKLILLPWKDVFTRGSMQAFLVRNIVPKLESSISGLVINPHNQNLDLWRSVIEWDDFLPPPQLADILAKNFFPRWLQVLAAWLNSNPNYEEVTGWYQGWKGVIPVAVVGLPGVADYLSQALHMMNRSVTGGGPLASQPGALENVKYLTNREAEAGRSLPGGQDVPKNRKFDTISEAVKTSAQIPQGFKDLIARRCEERGIVFYPVAGKMREAKQVFVCGRRNIYLDRNVIFVQDDAIWVPTSLNSLVDNA